MVASKKNLTTYNKTIKSNIMKKSTIEEIQERFDNDVERFSNLETGQVSTIDAKISLELITEASKRIAPHATQLLDIGCGAGNYSLMMLSKIPNLNCTLVDLSKPMLDKGCIQLTNATWLILFIVSLFSIGVKYPKVFRGLLFSCFSIH